MKVIYIAEDGTQFKNENECKDYEWKMNHFFHLKDILFYDIEGKSILSSPFEDIHYNQVETIIIPNEEALKDLRALADYTGFCEYDDINTIGIWKHFNHNLNTGFQEVKENDLCN